MVCRPGRAVGCKPSPASTAIGLLPWARASLTCGTGDRRLHILRHRVRHRVLLRQRAPDYLSSRFRVLYDLFCGSQLCGAGGRLNVYRPVGTTPVTLAPVGAFVYQRCCIGSPGRVLSGTALYYDDMTLEMCAAACSSYTWFRVE